MQKEIKKQSLPLALLLSFLIALASAVIWGVFYFIGFTSSWVSFLASFLMVMVYLKFYNKKNILLYLWTIGAVVLLNGIATIFAILITFMLEQGINFVESIEYFNSMIVLAFSVIVDLVVGACFALAGILLYFYIYKKRATEKTEIEIEQQISQNQNASMDEISEQENEGQDE